MRNPLGRFKTTTYSHVGPLTVLFALLVAVCVILERVGVPISIIKTLLVTFLGAAMIGIGLSSGTMQPARYFATGRTMQPGISAIAIASVWMSGSVLLALPGYFGLDTQAALAFAGASLLGLLVLGVTVGPAFNAAGAYALGDFMRIRFASRTAQIVAALLSIGLCSALLVSQFTIMAFFVEQLLPVGPLTAIIIIVIPVGFSVWLGGMLGASRAESLIYLIALAGFVAPLAFFLFNSGAQSAIETFSAIDSAHFVPAQTRAGAPLFSGGDIPPVPRTGWFSLSVTAFLCIAAVSSLPHLLGLFSTVPEPRAARGTAYRAILLVLVPLLAVPFHTAFAQILVTNSLVGLTAGEIGRFGEWVFSPAQSLFGPLFSICGKSASSVESVVAACGSASHRLEDADIAINAAIVPLTMTARDDLPVLFGGVFSLAILLAAASTAIALIQTIAATVSQDLFRGLLAPTAPPGARLAVARAGGVIVCAVAGHVAYTYPQTSLNMIVWIAGLCAAAFFPPLQLSIFWNRMTGTGAVAGMVSGFACAAFGMVIKTWGAGIVPARGIGALPEFLELVEKADVTTMVLAGMVVSGLGCVAGSLFTSAPRHPSSGMARAASMSHGIPRGNHQDYS